MQVRYTILNPVAEFNMTPASGVLRTTGVKLDREAVAVYTLLVEARDRRTPPNVAHAKVIVSVADVNDNTPTFYGQPYHMRVTSDAAFGHVVGTVRITDVVLSSCVFVCTSYVGICISVHRECNKV